MLCETGLIDGEVDILDRIPNLYASTFPSEIVICKIENGKELKLFCKYAAGYSHNAHGHRGGVSYEASVYRYLLQPLGASVPVFYGMYVDEPADNIWLALEYLDNSQRLSEIPIPPTQPLIQVVRSIGRMHAVCETSRSRSSGLILKSYDAEYYHGWAYRTRQFSCSLHQRYPWLPTLCERFEQSLIPLLTSPPTLIHGECYPENVLVRDKDIYLVDWESAAMGAGEIDLASITEAWPEATVQECALAYERARWPKGSPADFLCRFDLARAYVQLRWLGDRPEWTSDPSVAVRFEQLGCLGEKLRLI